MLAAKDGRASLAMTFSIANSEKNPEFPKILNIKQKRHVMGFYFR
jgi:hypothetical protein